MSGYYDRQGVDPSEYGGGGRGGDNYYDQSQRYDETDEGRGYGRQQGGRGEDFGERRQHGGHGGGDGYGRQEERYGGGDGYGGGGYGDEPPRRQGRRDDEGGYGRQEGFGDERPYERRHEERYGGSSEGGGYGGGSSYGGGSGAGYGGGGSGDFDQDEVLRHSQRHGNSGDSDLFSQAMSFLGNNKHSAQSEAIDEGRLQQSHQQLYQQDGGGQQHDASSLGAGAAMQALKMFSGGGSSGGSSQSQMIAMAMQEASKLFDKQSNQGNVASGTDKQSAVNMAAKMALQMYMKGGAGGGGGGGGSASGLMGLASKFFS